MSLGGFGVGLLAMLAVMSQAYLLGLALLVVNRIADGLDGAVARHSRLTDLGGFLDIVLDFIVYAGMVFAFAVADPARNALAAALLLFAFMGTGSSFLAFAIMAAKRRLSTDLRGRKSLYYLGGLAEGTETILFMVLACLLPGSVRRPRLCVRRHVLADDAGSLHGRLSTAARGWRRGRLNAPRASAIKPRTIGRCRAEADHGLSEPYCSSCRTTRRMTRASNVPAG